MVFRLMRRADTSVRPCEVPVSRAFPRIWRHRLGAVPCMVAERPGPPRRRGGRRERGGRSFPAGERSRTGVVGKAG